MLLGPLTGISQFILQRCEECFIHLKFRFHEKFSHVKTFSRLPQLQEDPLVAKGDKGSKTYT